MNASDIIIAYSLLYVAVGLLTWAGLFFDNGRDGLKALESVVFMWPLVFIIIVVGLWMQGTVPERL